MGTWSVSPNATIIPNETGATITFPENRSYSDIRYTITYEKDNGESCYKYLTVKAQDSPSTYCEVTSITSNVDSVTTTETDVKVGFVYYPFCQDESKRPYFLLKKGSPNGETVLTERASTSQGGVFQLSDINSRIDISVFPPGRYYIVPQDQTISSYGSFYIIDDSGGGDYFDLDIKLSKYSETSATIEICTESSIHGSIDCTIGGLTTITVSGDGQITSCASEDLEKTISELKADLRTAFQNGTIGISPIVYNEDKIRLKWIDIDNSRMYYCYYEDENNKKCEWIDIN